MESAARKQEITNNNNNNDSVFDAKDESIKPCRYCGSQNPHLVFGGVCDFCLEKGE